MGSGKSDVSDKVLLQAKLERKKIKNSSFALFIFERQAATDDNIGANVNDNDDDDRNSNNNNNSNRLNEFFFNFLYFNFKYI